MIKNFKEVISQIKNQVPIQDLIAEYLTLKKSGRGYVALCPFHDDHHPSLQIHTQKGIFKCFSCGAGGDIITFYSQYNKRSWQESVTELAVKYGIKIEYGFENKAEVEIKKQLYELNRIALSFYKNNLFSNKGNEALDYLKNKRGLTPETIEKYEIGFALNEWDTLYNYFVKEKHFPRELIIASGLFIPQENEQSYYDRFRNRIIFPIIDENEKIIAFGGRCIEPVTSEVPKYINSPETLIYSKGNNLYGLYFAKEEIKAKDFVILTEGYLDVLTAHQHKLLNTVALLGTALTQNQLRLLAKHTTSKRIYLCLDTDAAGIKATENIFRLLQDSKDFLHCDIRVLSSLLEKDLDESLRKHSINDFYKSLEKSKKLNLFILDKLAADYDKANISGNEISKKLVMEEITKVLLQIRDPLEQKQSIQYLSHKIEIDEEIISFKLKNELKLKRKKEARKKLSQYEDDEFKMYTNERFMHAERELLLLYISSFPLVEQIKNKMAEITFIDEKHKLIKEFLDNLEGEEITPYESLNRLTLEFNEFKHIMSVISDLAFQLELDEKQNENHYIKNKEKILNEAKEWINWWITNKQKMKELTLKLKDSKTSEEETDVISEMMKIIKDNKQ